MENKVWTFFCGSGAYDGAYKPVLRRYVCYGGVPSLKAAVSEEGTGRNRLILRLRERQIRLTDEQGNTVDLRQAAICPGDRIAAGYAQVPEKDTWRITSVVPAAEGMSANRGWVITAE